MSNPKANKANDDSTGACPGEECKCDSCLGNSETAPSQPAEPRATERWSCRGCEFQTDDTVMASIHQNHYGHMSWLSSEPAVPQTTAPEPDLADMIKFQVLIWFQDRAITVDSPSHEQLRDLISRTLKKYGKVAPETVVRMTDGDGPNIITVPRGLDAENEERFDVLVAGVTVSKWIGKPGADELSKNLAAALAKLCKEIGQAQAWGEKLGYEELERRESRAKEILYKELDRVRDGESLISLCSIAANAIYWRSEEIKKLTAKVGELERNRDILTIRNGKLIGQVELAVAALDRDAKAIREQKERAEAAEAKLATVKEMLEQMNNDINTDGWRQMVATALSELDTSQPTQKVVDSESRTE